MVPPSLQTGYAAGGMLLAVTQGDFLVETFFDKLLFEKEALETKINKENTIVFIAFGSLCERSSLSKEKFSII